MRILEGILDVIFPDSPRFSRDPRARKRPEYKIEKRPRPLTIACYDCYGTGDDKNDYNPATGEYYPCKVCHGSGERLVEDKK
jgi:hypothetical protein